MYPRDQLRRTLGRIDGSAYPSYRDLSGAYDFGAFRLHIDHVQPDPFASPSRLRVAIAADASGLAPADWQGTARRVGLEDWLLRRLASALRRAADATPAGGAGDAAAGSPAPRRTDPAGPPAGCLRVLLPGQQVVERSAVSVREGAVEVRLTCDLPADRRAVLGQRAAAALAVALPAAIAAMLPRGPADAAGLASHLALIEDQEALRAELPRRGWVAFLADGAILPRETGSSDRPLPKRAAVRLVAPEALAATVELPHRGGVRGLPIPAGVTLIVGGAYHGKSTLLRAIERGVYNHIAGDGRELCVTDAAAVSVATEDGRPVSGVDISAFVRPLPGGADTHRYRTLAASGSTSQAAGLCEALEAGATCLLLDEDRGAANFMSRDDRMRALVPDDEDPVVPFVDRVRWLHRQRGVSSVVVLGGAGTFLDVADLVVRMREYQPADVTAAAASVTAAQPGGPRGAFAEPEAVPPRLPAPEPFAAAIGTSGRVRARPRGRDGLVIGEAAVDLRGLSQIAEEAQVRALADMLPRAAAYADGRRTLAEVVAEVEADIDRLGLQALSPWAGQCPGDYARPRGVELAAAINRVPALRLAGDPAVPVLRGHRHLSVAALRRLPPRQDRQPHPRAGEGEAPSRAGSRPPVPGTRPARSAATLGRLSRGAVARSTAPAGDPSTAPSARPVAGAARPSRPPAASGAPAGAAAQERKQPADVGRDREAASERDKARRPRSGARTAGTASDGRLAGPGSGGRVAGSGSGARTAGRRPAAPGSDRRPAGPGSGRPATPPSGRPAGRGPGLRPLLGTLAGFTGSGGQGQRPPGRATPSEHPAGAARPKAPRPRGDRDRT